MKTKWIWIFGILAIVILVGYIGYKKIVLPRYLTNLILEEKDTPSIIPNRYAKRLVKARKRINASVDSALTVIHRNNITIDQLLKAIDDVEEKQVYACLDELNSISITNTDQVFDIGKKYFKTDFDIELFRPDFRQYVTLPMIKKGLKYANKQRADPEMDPETAKTIAKQILIEKEKKYTMLEKIRTKH